MKTAARESPVVRVGEGERPGSPGPIRRPDDPRSLPSLLRMAAHQLSQPLTVCRGTLELALLKGRNASDYRTACERAYAAFERMVSVVQTLQDLADVSEPPENRLVFDLNVVLHQVVEELTPFAEAHRVLLKLERGAAAMASGDEARCHQAFLMVVRHAILRASENGRVELCLAVSDKMATVLVECLTSPRKENVANPPASTSPSAGFRFGRAEDEWALAAPRLALHMLGGRMTSEEVSPIGFRVRITLPTSRSRPRKGGKSRLRGI